MQKWESPRTHAVNCGMIKHLPVRTERKYKRSSCHFFGTCTVSKRGFQQETTLNLEKNKKSSKRFVFPKSPRLMSSRVWCRGHRSRAVSAGPAEASCRANASDRHSFARGITVACLPNWPQQISRSLDDFEYCENSMRQVRMPRNGISYPILLACIGPITNLETDVAELTTCASAIWRFLIRLFVSKTFSHAVILTRFFSKRIHTNVLCVDFHRFLYHIFLSCFCKSLHKYIKLMCYVCLLFNTHFQIQKIFLNGITTLFFSYHVLSFSWTRPAVKLFGYSASGRRSTPVAQPARERPILHLEVGLSKNYEFSIQYYNRQMKYFTPPQTLCVASSTHFRDSRNYGSFPSLKVVMLDHPGARWQLTSPIFVVIQPPGELLGSAMECCTSKDPFKVLHKRLCPNGCDSFASQNARCLQTMFFQEGKQDLGFGKSCWNISSESLYFVLFRWIS